MAEDPNNVPIDNELKAQIRAIALNSGFELKRQPNGGMDLHPYVYKFAVAIIEESMAQFHDAQAVEMMKGI